MKTIKINFADFWDKFDKKDNFITNVLNEKYHVEISDNPDYLFYSCFGLSNIEFDGIKILYSGEDIFPDFNLCDYAISFPDIKVTDRYLRYPIFAWSKEFEIAKTKHIFNQEDIRNKDKFCNFVYSNFKANPLRKEFFEALSKYKKVDSGGRYLNNIGFTVQDKLTFQSQYKFSIAFENGQSDDYTTEKITDAFAARTIPIYWGNKKVTDDFNEEAFINCNSYSSFEDVIQRIIEIDNNQKLFEEILHKPIFNYNQNGDKFSKEILKKFLYNIFDQDLDKASRRSKYTFREQYNNSQKQLFRSTDSYIKRDDSRKKIDDISKDCFEENFNEYVNNNIDINLVYQKHVEYSNYVNIDLVKEENNANYVMKLEYKLNDNDYVKIIRMFMRDKIKNWSNKKGIEIVLIPDDSNRDLIVSIVDGSDNGANWLFKSYKLEGRERKKLEILFEDLESGAQYGDCKRYFNYSDVNLFELVISNQRHGLSGRGSITIETIKLF